MHRTERQLWRLFRWRKRALDCINGYNRHRDNRVRVTARGEITRTAKRCQHQRGRVVRGSRRAHIAGHAEEHIKKVGLSMYVTGEKPTRNVEFSMAYSHYKDGHQTTVKAGLRRQWR